jgi:uncharacterized protein with NRDE domain
LNPIEHIWWHFKTKISEPTLNSRAWGLVRRLSKALENALKKAWEHIDDSIIESCFESMRRRRDVVIAAKGWHTKY